MKTSKTVIIGMDSLHLVSFFGYFVMNIDVFFLLRNNNSFMHLKIVCEQNKYILGQFSKPFDTVPEMIHYYSVNKLNIKGAIHKKLLHPIMEMPEYQTLEPMGLNTAM